MGMSALEKEQIFTELRKYHQDEFPSTMTNQNMTDLLGEFRELEDKIVNMLLSLVNGKVALVDLTPDLRSFANKAKVTPKGDRAEDDNRNLFIAKIEHLSQILNMAGLATFRLKVPRFSKKDQEGKPQEVAKK